jgi:DNA invertase Pin-like site-specific DNA recombinase
MTYGYLRVSSDKQDVASQQIGVERKANELNVIIDEWIKDEGVSGVKEYNKRNLGVLMNKAKAGDIIIVSEISRLARSVFMLFRIVEYCMDNDIVIYSVKDSVNTLKKGDLIAMMAVFFFGIAAQIEREMIVKRTIEGVERRKKDGVIFGRPPGDVGTKKLDGKEELIREYINAGLSVCQLAKMLKVHRQTVRRFCKEKEIELHAISNYQNKDKMDNKWHRTGREADEILESEKEYIVSLIDQGMTNKYILEKINEKGHQISVASFCRWFKNDREFYNSFVEKIKEVKKIRNVDCGKKKQHYQF